MLLNRISRKIDSNRFLLLLFYGAWSIIFWGGLTVVWVIADVLVNP